MINRLPLTDYVLNDVLLLTCSEQASNLRVTGFQLREAKLE